jgi:hypothetical protein
MLVMDLKTDAVVRVLKGGLQHMNISIRNGARLPI